MKNNSNVVYYVVQNKCINFKKYNSNIVYYAVKNILVNCKKPSAD